MGGFVFVFIITGTEHMRVTIFPKPKKIKGGGDPMKVFSLAIISKESNSMVERKQWKGLD